MHVGLLWNVPIKEAENIKLETRDFCSTENGELIHGELMETRVDTTITESQWVGHKQTGGLN